jgi:hypothetical protein
LPLQILSGLITPQVDPLVLIMFPSGQFLAIGGAAPNPDSYGNTQTPGLEVFHFNGADPITSYSGTLTTTPINEIHWDNNNHMYAVSNSTKKTTCVHGHLGPHLCRARLAIHHSGHAECAGSCAYLYDMQRAVYSRSPHLRSGQRLNHRLAAAGEGRGNREWDHLQHAAVD